MLQQGQPPLLQPGPLVLGVRPRHRGERLAVPPGQCRVVQPPRPMVVALRGGLLRLGDARAGRVHVQFGVRPQPDRVAAGLADQSLGAQHLAQPRGVGAQRGQGPLRRFLAPQRAHQLLCGGRLPAAQQQGRQQGALLRGADAHGLAVAPGAHGPQHGETQPVVAVVRLLSLASRVPLAVHGAPCEVCRPAAVSVPCRRSIRQPCPCLSPQSSQTRDRTDKSALRRIGSRLTRRQTACRRMPFVVTEA